MKKNLYIIFGIISVLLLQNNTVFGNFETYQKRVKDICNPILSEKAKNTATFETYPYMNIGTGATLQDIKKFYPQNFLQKISWLGTKAATTIIGAPANIIHGVGQGAEDIIEGVAGKDIEDVKNKDTSVKVNLQIDKIVDISAKNYSTNMNGLYRCAILGLQYSSFKNIETLINQNGSTDQKNKIGKKVKSELKKIQKKQKSLECKTKNTGSIQKVQILKEASYEICSYHAYLEYLRDQSENLKNITQGGEPINRILEKKNKINEQIDQEIEKAYKLFPIAYQSYTQYENNFTVHLLLQVLKEDFILFRRKYHQSIGPINQLVYKVANAMKP